MLRFLYGMSNKASLQEYNFSLALLFSHSSSMYFFSMSVNLLMLQFVFLRLRTYFRYLLKIFLKICSTNDWGRFYWISVLRTSEIC